MSFTEPKASLSSKKTLYDPGSSFIFVVVAWNVGTGTTSISSQKSRGMTNACPWPSMIWNRRMKPSGLKWAEHNHDVDVGSHFTCFAFTYSTHWRLLLLVFGRLSSSNGKVWVLDPQFSVWKVNEMSSNASVCHFRKTVPCYAHLTGPITTNYNAKIAMLKLCHSVYVTAQLLSHSLSLKNHSSLHIIFLVFQTSLHN